MKRYLFLLLITLTIPAISFSQALSGTYSIGSDDCDYTTVSAALVDLEVFGVEGQTILELQNSYDYNNEPDAPRFTTYTGSSEINNIILTVADNVDEIVLGGSPFANIISFYCAQYVEIQGKGKLILQTSEFPATSIPIHILSFLSFSGTIITIDGCTIIGCGDDRDETGIRFFSNYSPGSEGIGYNVTISNNTFYRIRTAIYALDTNNFGKSNKEGYINIINNTIGDNRENYHISENAINLANIDNVLIENNDIFSTFTTEGTAAAINLRLCGKIRINNNIIRDIVSYDEENGKAYGIYIYPGYYTITEVWCYNNMISHIAAKEAHGISLNSANIIANTFHIYYNSIYLTINNSQEFFGQVPSSCLNIDSPMGTFLVRNNIFQNDFGDNPTSSEDRYSTAVSFVGENNPFSAITNNIFYTNEVTNGYTAKNNDRYFDFDEWNEFNDNDTTSLDKNPKFVSTYLLKIEEGNAGGIPLPLITTDYFGKHRNTKHPDIGAHESKDNAGINHFSSFEIDTYYYDNFIYINSEYDLNGSLSFVSLDGRILYKTNISGKNIRLNLNRTFNSGVYIVHYQDKVRRFSSKVHVY